MLHKARFIFVSTLTAVATPALSAPIEEVYVTGELRSADALTLANSVTVVNESLIDARHALNLESLLNLAPNVNYSTGASRGRFIQIRGIGERSQYASPINPSVGVLVDGIDFTGIATGVTTVDTQQVEIFRGPQGTLYGANALAGMINVVGNAPTESPYFKIKAGAGNYNSYDLNAIYSTALTESIGWRIAGLQTQSDGFIDNAYLDTQDTNNIDELSLRNQFAFKLGEETQLDWTTYYVDADNGYDAFSLDNNRTTLSDEPGRDTQSTLANALHLRHQGLSFADIDATLSHARSEIEYGYDEDWSYLNICAIDSDCAYWQYSTTDYYLRDNDNTSLDVRLISRDEGQALNWVAGVYVRQQQVDLERQYTNNMPDGDPYTPIAPDTSVYTSDYQTDNRALYGELQWRVAPSWTLIGGLRGEQFSADFSDSQAVQFEPSSDLWGGKLAAEFSQSEQHMLYGLISRGYKPGGFNPDPELEESLKQFGTETMLNYEIGSKGLWLDGTLSLQLAAFYQQRSDIQVKQSRAYPSDAGFEFVEFFTNDADGANYGLEAEANWAASDTLTLFASLGLLETEYQNFINLSHVDRDPETGEGYDMSQRDQAQSPAYQFYAGAEWDVLDALSLRFETEGKDSFYFSESHNEQSEAYTLFNLRLDYRIQQWELALWGKNLTDETVETRGFYFSHDFGNDPRKFYAPEPYTQKGAPRTWGITVAYEM